MIRQILTRPIIRRVPFYSFLKNEGISTLLNHLPSVCFSSSSSSFSSSLSSMSEKNTFMTTNSPYRNHSTTSTTSGGMTDDDTSIQSSSVYLSIEEVRSTTTQALLKLGWDQNSASIQADIMTAAEISGNNQGLVKMMQPVFMSPSIDASSEEEKQQQPSIERETSTSAVINGNQCPGMIVASLAADLATRKVLQQNSIDDDDDSCTSKIHNYQLHNTQQQWTSKSTTTTTTTTTTTEKKPPVIAIVATYNTCTSSGQLGYYVKKMAEEGVIGIAMVNSPEYVAAAPGAKPTLGTNPIAVGIPTINSPFVFDMATSAIALFGVMLANAKNQPLPSQVAYGKDGHWTTNPSEALPGGGGAIATFGGHKGMGLSLCVELLSGVLSGGAVLGQIESKKIAKSNGHLFIAIRPDGLVDNFEEKVTSVLTYIKESGDNVRIPGEKSTQTAKERLKEGYIYIPIQVWEQIVNLASK